MRTSLGIWALGPMITRFVPSGYQPQHANEPMPVKVRRAVEGLGDLMDDYEFHYPGELNPDNLDEVRDALDGHGIATVCTGLHTDPRFGKGGLTSVDPAVARRGAPPDPGDGRAGGDDRGEHDLLAGDRGLQLPLPDAVRAVLGMVPRGDGGGGRGLCEARRQAVPRAQELRAGDEDLHAQHRDDPARDPHAARTGDHERPGQHGLAAPDHERREPRRVRGDARCRRAPRPSARELGLGDVRRRQHGRRHRVHGDARARRGAPPGALRREPASASGSTSIRTPRTRSPPSLEA